MTMSTAKQAKARKLKGEKSRTGLKVETLKRAFEENLFYTQFRIARVATASDRYMALALTLRDRLAHRWINTVESYLRKDVKVVCYLSAEFLLGPGL